MSHVVLLYTPWLPETEGMIRSHHFKLMRHEATFIKTARGAIVNEPEMIEALIVRPACSLSLTSLTPNLRLLSLSCTISPNVVLTPPIAGALGREPRRNRGERHTILHMTCKKVGPFTGLLVINKSWGLCKKPLKQASMFRI